MITESSQNEFWYHVANQDEIPIAGTIDKSIDLVLLKEIVDNFPDDDYSQVKYIASLIKSLPSVIDLFRTLVGVSDKRMYLELSYVFAKEKYSPNDNTNILNDSIYNLNKHPLSFFKGLINNQDKKLAIKSAEIIADYLNKRNLSLVISAFRKLDINHLEIIIEKLIITKEVQQAEAKRRGHGAEYTLAVLLSELDCDIIPKNRHTKPMGFKDPNVDRDTFEICKKKKGKTWSFDLIIEHKKIPYVFIQSLIHTSDPGQYGVNKSDETVQIKQDLSKHNKKYGFQKQLWGIVDGVGFCENKKDTIDKMIGQFDSFLQMKSIYKAGLKLHQLGMTRIKGIKFDNKFYTQDDAERMFAKYCDNDIEFVVGNKFDKGIPLKAGMAILFV